MKDIHENEYAVRVINTDLFNLCRPSSLMDFLQEAATEHAVRLKIAREDLADKHAIWMLVRLKYTLLRPIRGGEKLRVQTSYRKPKGVYILRDFELFVGDEHVGSALSTWVLADAENRTLLRSEDVLPALGEEDPEDEGKEKLGKIRMPREMEDAGERVIGYSETDVNGHANNTRYADYACDAMHFEACAGQYIREMQITYSAECLAGQTIHLQRQRVENTVYVRGVDKDGKPHFDIRMELAEI